MSVSDDTVVNPDLPADFQGELAYWDLELSLKGHYPQVILNRLDPKRMGEEFPGYLMPIFETLRQDYRPPIKVLDVGSGPFSMLALGDVRKYFELTAVDPLADRYKELLEKYGYSVEYGMARCFGERLVAAFGREVFHLVWIHNALDHTQCPDVVVKEMVQVLRTGGYLVIQSWSREGTAESYVGLHQHDLYVQPEGQLMCESRCEPGRKPGEPHCITEGLPIELVEQSEPTSEVKKWIKLVYRKTGLPNATGSFS